jgi:cytochrome c oxidase assembly protein subunit 15
VPAVTLGNLLGGLAMLGLSARLGASAGSLPGPSAGVDGPSAPATADRVRLATAARALLALVFAQAALGALASASYAGLSCATLADCWHGATGVDAATLDPWREPRIAPGGGAAEPGALIQLLHRAGAVGVGVGAAAVAALAWRRRRTATSVALVALVALEIALGLAMVGAALPPGQAVLHNIVAALLVALLARAA